MTTNNIPTHNYVGDLSFEERNDQLAAMLEARGFRQDRLAPRVPLGSKLLPVGKEKQRAYQKGFEEMEDLDRAIENLRRLETLEQWADVPTEIQMVRMGPDGSFYRKEVNKSLAMTHTGLQHVVSFLGGPPHLFRTLAELPPPLRADVFNHFAERSERKENVLFRTALVPTEGRAPQRVILGVVSPVYKGIRESRILELYRQVVPRGAKVRITRGEDRTDLELIWPMLDREIRVGDLVWSSLRGWNSQVKVSGAGVESSITRAVCWNLTTATDTITEIKTVRHVGDLEPKIIEGVLRALARLTPFIEAFGDAYRKPLPDFAPTRGEVLERVGKVHALPDRILDRAGQVWDADGAQSAGDTLAGLANALTRAAQEETISSAAEVEEVAGRLVVRGWEDLE